MGSLTRPSDTAAAAALPVTANQPDTATPPDTSPLPRRWLAYASLFFLIVSFAQAPGRIAADTKLDLTENPLGFLARAAHLWTSIAPMGQVQNQAYGYFFPHGAFFALGHVLALPAWIAQRLWWAVLLTVGFWGCIRLAEALGIGSRSSRIVGAAVYICAPRALQTLGAISSETLPMMLAPWVLLPVVRAFQHSSGSTRSYAARSAFAVALMGAVNAVATVAAVLPAAIWWLGSLHRQSKARWLRFTGWWLLCGVLATAWWVSALLLLGRVSPPFLDYIESSRITTQWSSLVEVLRGATSWTPFVAPHSVAASSLTTSATGVLATGALAAAGLAGLASIRMPYRGTLLAILLFGVVGFSVGYAGAWGSPIADWVDSFLDSTGAPFRNVHKLDPLIRLPLALGVMHALSRVPLPGSVPMRAWRRALLRPERHPRLAATIVVVAALLVSAAPIWTGSLAPAGAYAQIPQYWRDAAAWLDDHQSAPASGRALVVPGTAHASQTWGTTRDEVLQALTRTPWAVRDSIPLVPPEAIRAMDAVQRVFADGRPSDGLAETLRGQGISHLVVRHDLDLRASPAARPIAVQQVLAKSPGVVRVAEFGQPPRAGRAAPGEPEQVEDSDLRPPLPPVQIYRIDGRTPTQPYVVDAAALPRLQAGPEAIEPLMDSGVLQSGVALLTQDARVAGLEQGPAIITDTPTVRETDYGRVDHHSSGILDPSDPRRTLNRAPDYSLGGAKPVAAHWFGARVTASSSAADATQLGAVSPAYGPASAVDNDPSTAWLSAGSEVARGQWLRLDFDRPVTSARVSITPAATAGVRVTWARVQTDHGTTSVKFDKPGQQVEVALPTGATSSVIITALDTENGSAGTQFGVAEVAVSTFDAAGTPQLLDIGRRIDVPTPSTSASDWFVHQEYPGRADCIDTPIRVRCAPGIGLTPEEPRTFSRTLHASSPVPVTLALSLNPRSGAELAELLREPGTAYTTGASGISDPRGTSAAATDGNERTTWTAPTDAARNPAGSAPTITLHLPTSQPIAALDLTSSRSVLPAHPRVVAVNLGDGPQVRTVSKSGLVKLHEFTTDTIEISVLQWNPVVDHDSLGFHTFATPGIAEVSALTPDGRNASPKPVLDRTIHLECGRGPMVQLGAQQVQTEVSVSATDLLAGKPITARPCGSAVLNLTPGGNALTVTPGGAFSVRSVHLHVPGGSRPTPNLSPLDHIHTWSSTHRSVDVDARATAQILVIPETTNPGWRAQDSTGNPVKAVTVSGWQQGWLLPAGPATTITLSFPIDHTYRLSLGVGFVLLMLAALLTLRPARHIHVPLPPAARTAVWARAPYAAAALITVATVGLATGPWRSASGYVGHSAWIQVTLWVALAITIIGGSARRGSAAPPTVSPPVDDDSRGMLN